MKKRTLKRLLLKRQVETKFEMRQGPPRTSIDIIMGTTGLPMEVVNMKTCVFGGCIQNNMWISTQEF